MPIDAAETIAYAEITEAVEEYEPRATISDITMEAGADGKVVYGKIEMQKKGSKSA